MPTYDANLFEPPAPVANITLRNPINGSMVLNVPMLLDSGADVTLIPENLLEQLTVDLEEGARYELVGFDGSRSFANVVRLNMVFLNRTFTGRFLTISQEWGIIGRDILNLVSIYLDGPKITWGEMSQD